MGVGTPLSLLFFFKIFQMELFHGSTQTEYLMKRVQNFRLHFSAKLQRETSFCVRGTIIREPRAHLAIWRGDQKHVSTQSGWVERLSTDCNSIRFPLLCVDTLEYE